MLAPETFQLPSPLDSRKHPPPKLPSYLKHQVYDDPNVFEKVDSHALRVSQTQYYSFKDLLWDLVYRYKLSDLEKARVIFRWMTARDMKTMTFQKVNSNSPEELLLSLNDLTASYSSVYELICSYAGLHCVTLAGYAKGVDYRPGDEFKIDNFNHTWNAIYLDGSWQLIDVHWATRYLASSKHVKESIVYQYDDFYFIMEPQQAVYSHFPKDTEWQLLERPLTLNQFVHLPLTKSQFFKCGMDFLQQQHGVVHSKDGHLKMTLGFWKPDSFTYSISTADKKDSHNGIALRYFMLQETADNKINYYFRLPMKGVFYLTVYAQELSEHNKSIDSPTQGIFRAACEYKIIADTASENQTPYPMTCHDSNWGPSWSLMSHYGLVPAQDDGVITISDRSGEIPIVIKFDRRREEVSLIAKLQKNGVDDDDILDEYIQIEETNTATIFTIKLPEPGEFGLEIYASEPEEKDTYTHVCQYLLDIQPPPGYWPPPPEKSIFGKIKPEFKPPSTYRGNNIKDMYNYEKDATPLGTLPRPYKPTQYTPEEATMIPGQQKAKPKPFAYKEKSNPVAVKKNDSDDNEMPNFPPPPLGGMEQNIAPEYGKSVYGAPSGQQEHQLPYTPGGTGQNPYYQGNGHYNTGQAEPVGENFKPTLTGQENSRPDVKNPDGYNQENYPGYQGNNYGRTPQGKNILGPTPYKPYDSGNNVGQENSGPNATGPAGGYIKPGQPGYQGNNYGTTPSGAPIKPGQPGYQGNYGPGYQDQSPHGGSLKPGQPGYQGNYGPGNQGQSPSGAPIKPGQPGYQGNYGPGYQGQSPSGAPIKPGQPGYQGDNVGKGPGTNQKRSSQGDDFMLPPAPVLHTDDDDDDDSRDRLQPYLASVSQGQSPHLTRKVFDPQKKSHYGDRNQSPSSSDSGRRGLTGDNVNDPKSKHRTPSAERKDYSELSSLNKVSSAFGKSSDSLTDKQPYLQNLVKGGSPNLSRRVIPGQVSPSSGNQFDRSNLSKGNSPSTSQERLNREESENINKDMYNKPAPFRGYGRPNFSNTNKPMAGEPGGSNGAGGFGGAGGPGGPGGVGRAEGQNNIVPTTVVGQYHTPSQLASRDLGQNQYGGGTTDPTVGYSPYKSQARHGTPGYQMGSYINKEPQKSSAAPTAGGKPPTGYSGKPEDGVGKRDPTKVSNIAVTLSPSGYKKPNRIDLTSDQYNKEYEGSRKVMPSPLQKYRPDDSTANWTSGPVQKEPPKNFKPEEIIVAEPEKPKLEALPTDYQGEAIVLPEETSKIFRKVDEHAMEVSSQHQESFNQLIWQLIYARNITDDLEKVRVIFLWLCTKDLHKMTFDNIKKDSPEEILMGIKNGKSTYAHVFFTLCRYAGLHCKLIVGYAKGADYAPGMRFQGRVGEHSWNAVLIDGVWRLIDCHWAARRLIGKEHKPENVRYELDMFYFLANPSQLIYTHFPHDKDWQLLHHSISIEEFEALAPVKSMFFKYNLDLLTHKNAVIKTNHPEIELRIAIPSGVEERLLFTFTLSFEDGSDQYGGLPLTKYGRQEIDFENNQSVFWIRTPISGNYKLLLYAKLMNSETGQSDAASSASTTGGGTTGGTREPKMFGAICEYKVEATFQSTNIVPPFPSCQSTAYGPNEVYKLYPIEALNWFSSFLTQNGSAEVRFAIHQPDLRIVAKLNSTRYPDTDKLTQQSVLQRMVAGREAIITLFLPDEGEYGLEIFANDPKKNGNSFFTVWQYFIVSKSGTLVKGLPTIMPGSLGPYEPKFSQYGLSTLSHPDPFISITSAEEAIDLQMTRDKPLRLMANLIHCTHDVNEPCSNRILQQQDMNSTTNSNVVSLVIRPPRSGFYKLQIYALPYSELSETLPGVFNYLIEVGNTSGAAFKVEFPQQFANWKEGCFLYEPLDAELPVTTTPVKFRMVVPRARNVAVVTGANNEWVRLEKSSSSDTTMPDSWFGQISTSNLSPGSEVSVCVNLAGTAAADGTNDSFITVLKYYIGNN